jgi:hypothetical protein
LLTAEGLQLPATPLSDVAGKDGTEPPEHIVRFVPKLNVGFAFGLTVTLNVVVVAHCPAAGVNVYTADDVLLTVEGLQLPEIPSLEFVASEGTVAPAQIVRDVPKLNVGVTLGFTVTAKVAFSAHCPAVGVNV